MPKKFEVIREDLLNVPHDNKAASGPDLMKRNDPANRTKAMARRAQTPSVKAKITAIAGKQYEPNRMKTRHPATPHQRVTGPNELGSMGEATGLEGLARKYLPGYGKAKAHASNAKHFELERQTTGAARKAHQKAMVSTETILSKHKPEQKGLSVGSHEATGGVYEETISELDKGTLQRYVQRKSIINSYADMRGANKKVTPASKLAAHKDMKNLQLAAKKINMKEDAANTSQEGKFDPVESNKDFEEKLKKMVYDRAKNPVKESTMKKSLKQIREGRNSEYSANRELSSTSSMKRKPGHYLMRHGAPIHNEPHATSQQALSAYHNLSDKSNVKIQHIKEQFMLGDKCVVDCDNHPRHGQVGTLQGVDHMGGHHLTFKDGQTEPFEQTRLQKMAGKNSAVGAMTGSGVAESVAMAAGAAGDPGAVQDPTSNYAAQLGMGQDKRKKQIKLFRRPRPGSTMSGNKP